MKLSTVFRIGALGVLGVVLLAWAGALSAADPTGASPQDAIPVGVGGTNEICTSLTLGPGAQMWIKVPYDAGTDLEMRVKTDVSMTFDVFDPSQVANWPTLPVPIGRILPDPNEPGYADTWKGKLNDGDASSFYFVLVTNPHDFPTTFSFCASHAEQFSFNPDAPGPAVPGESSSSAVTVVSSSSSDSKSSSSDSFSSDSSASTPD